jgi:hypothetical protein
MSMNLLSAVCRATGHKKVNFIAVYIYSGEFTKFSQQNMLSTQAAFLTSCKLMELDVTGNTTVLDSDKLRSITIGGTLYTERRLLLSVEFLGGLFMKIEQKAEYTG